MRIDVRRFSVSKKVQKKGKNRLKMPIFSLFLLAVILAKPTKAMLSQITPEKAFALVVYGISVTMYFLDRKNALHRRG